jgi:WD40 repeat protein
MNWNSSNVFATLVFWDVATQSLLASLSVTGWCTSMTFSADGNTLATLSGLWETPQARVDLWNVPSGRQISSLAISPPDFAGGLGKKLALTPDTKFAAVAGKRLKVIDLTTGKELWSTNSDLETWGFECLALSPDGKTLVSGGGRRAPFPSVAVWDLASGKEIGPWLKELQTGPDQVYFAPDGKTLVAVGGDQSIRLWDIRDQAGLHPRGRPLRGHRSGIFTAALAADGKTLLTYAADYSIYAWNIERVEPEPGILNWTNAATWAFGPENRALVIAYPQGEIAEWHGPDFQTKTSLFNVGPDAEDARFSEDGRWFAATYRGGKVKVWDLLQHSLRCELNVNSENPGICGWSPDGKHVILGTDSAEIVEWDLTATNRIRSWPRPKNTYNVSADPTWRWLIHRSERPADILSLMEMATRESRAFTPQLRRVLATAFSPDGNLVAASSYLGSVCIWQTSTLQETCTLGDFQYPIYSVGFSPDQTRVLTSSGGRHSVQLYDLKNHQELLSLPTDKIKTEDARFSPDGNVIGFRSPWMLHVVRAPTFAEIEVAERAQGASRNSKQTR